jgi:Gamma-glutamyltranspeptidase
MSGGAHQPVLEKRMQDRISAGGLVALIAAMMANALPAANAAAPLAVESSDGMAVTAQHLARRSRIITTVLEIIINFIDHGMTVQETVDAPRLHHQWLPDTLAAEPLALCADSEKALTQIGYHLVPLEPWGTRNAAEAIGIAPADPKQASALAFPRPGLLYGASDSRAAAGSAAAPSYLKDARPATMSE